MTDAPFAACTIVTASHLSRAAVLAGSLGKVHPDVVLQVVVIDAPPHHVTAPGGTRLLPVSALPIGEGEFLDMVAVYTPLELSCALKPWVVMALFDGGARRVLYLDADVLVLDDLGAFARESDGPGMAFTPHLHRPIRAVEHETDVEGVILGSGLMNMGVFAASPRGVPFLRWWALRLRRDCVVDPARHMFVDQRWVDVGLTTFPHAVTEDGGVNVGWWSLSDREITASPSGACLIDGVPIRALHLSGFSPDAPHSLSVHAGPRPRVRMSEQPILRPLYAAYAAAVLDAGNTWAPETPYGFARLPGGLPYDASMQRVYRHALIAAEHGVGERPPRPFDPTGDGAFMAWLAAPTGPMGTAVPVSRYLRAVHLDVPALRERIPDLDRADPAALAAWLDADGCAAAMAARVLSPLPPPSLSRDRQGALMLVVSESGPTEGVEVDAVAVAMADAITDAGVAACHVTAMSNGWSSDASRRDLGPAPPVPTSALLVGGVEVIPSLHHAYRALGDAQMKQYGVIHWHGTAAPSSVAGALRVADVVFVPSRQARDALTCAGVSDVRVLGLPVLPTQSAGCREAHGLGSHPVIYTTVDLVDGGIRNDPAPLVAALDLMAGVTDPPHLVIGLRGRDDQVLAGERVRVLVADRDDVLVVAVPGGPPWADPWLAEADLVASLHRLEGFAWPAAVAMASGTRVIATAFGGNLDFMDASNAVLVEPAVLEPLGEDLAGAAAGSLIATLDPGAMAMALEAVLGEGGWATRQAVVRGRMVVERAFAPRVLAGVFAALPGVRA